VFLDESGFSLALSRRKRRFGSVLYGWGKKGEPLPTHSRVSDVEQVPARRGKNRGKNLSVLGAFDIEGMVATTSKQGAMTRSDFKRFLHTDLLPRLLPGSVLFLDNASIHASIHKGGQIEQLATKAGCRVLYLPPYSLPTRWPGHLR
jgi:hypothetical protein